MFETIGLFDCKEHKQYGVSPHWVSHRSVNFEQPHEINDSFYCHYYLFFGVKWCTILVTYMHIIEFANQLEKKLNENLEVHNNKMNESENENVFTQDPMAEINWEIPNGFQNSNTPHSKVESSLLLCTQLWRIENKIFGWLNKQMNEWARSFRKSEKNSVFLFNAV